MDEALEIRLRALEEAWRRKEGAGSQASNQSGDDTSTNEAVDPAGAQSNLTGIPNDVSL